MSRKEDILKEFEKKFIVEETFSRSGFNGMGSGGVFKNVRNDRSGIRAFLSSKLDEIEKEYNIKL